MLVRFSINMLCLSAFISSTSLVVNIIYIPIFCDHPNVLYIFDPTLSFDIIIINLVGLSVLCTIIRCTQQYYLPGIGFVTTQLIVGSISRTTSHVAKSWPRSKVRSFDRDIKSKLKIISLKVDSACDADYPKGRTRPLKFAI